MCSWRQARASLVRPPKKQSRHRPAIIYPDPWPDDVNFGTTSPRPRRHRRKTACSAFAATRLPQKRGRRITAFARASLINLPTPPSSSACLHLPPPPWRPHARQPLILHLLLPRRRFLLLPHPLSSPTSPTHCSASARRPIALLPLLIYPPILLLVFLLLSLPPLPRRNQTRLRYWGRAHDGGHQNLPPARRTERPRARAGGSPGTGRERSLGPGHRTRGRAGPGLTLGPRPGARASGGRSLGTGIHVLAGRNNGRPGGGG